MSFFKKDYSAYPQPVIVTPDPRYAGESISEAVAEAIDTEHMGSDSNSQQASVSRSIGNGNIVGEEQDRYSGQYSQLPPGPPQLADTQHESSSHLTTTQESHQQKDTAKLADGIMSLLGPIVQEMDFNIVSVRKSQSELEKEIERLMAELQLFMASSAAPPDVEPAVQKLLKARRQIMTANSTLKTVQERVDKMHLQIAKH
ncbi:hypothetical protein BGX27_001837 [Mortierella sp. AM989]|nr:hypothetical protein BGX27_001837 [Mortierella sp. AM989]